MSEQLKNFSEENPTETNGFSELAEMANDFDPDRAKQLRQLEQGLVEAQKDGDEDAVTGYQEALKQIENGPKEEILSTGEASKLTKSEERGVKIESEYMDAWSRYKDSENYDKDDKDLNQAIWDVGMGAALLDVNKDVIAQLQNGNISLENLDLKTQRDFDKALDNMAKIADSGNDAAKEATIEYIKNTGKVGEFLASNYEDWAEIKALLKASESEQSDSVPEKPKEDQNKLEYQQKYDALEKRLAELNSSKSIDPEDIHTLIAEYKEISRNAFDSNISEAAENRYRNLVNFSEQLEEINRKSNLL